VIELAELRVTRITEVACSEEPPDEFERIDEL
jgi:hypothetical protein